MVLVRVYNFLKVLLFFGFQMRLMPNRRVTNEWIYPKVRTSHGVGTVCGVYTSVAVVLWLGLNVPFVIEVVLNGDGPVTKKLKKKPGVLMEVPFWEAIIRTQRVRRTRRF
jgi:hypothetical protein